MYDPSHDTGHNFVMADARCNSKKSNMLVSGFYLAQWQARNHLHDHIIEKILWQKLSLKK